MPEITTMPLVYPCDRGMTDWLTRGYHHFALATDGTPRAVCIYCGVIKATP